MQPDVENLLTLAREDLALYAIAQWPKFQLAPHHAILVEKLEAVARGEVSRLMVFMPPRHGKSLISTQKFPAWYLGKNPSASIITGSYSQDLADDFGRRVRNLVGNEVHQAIFPGFRMAGDSKEIVCCASRAGSAFNFVASAQQVIGHDFGHIFLLTGLLVVPGAGLQEMRDRHFRCRRTWQVPTAGLEPGY